MATARWGIYKTIKGALFWGAPFLLPCAQNLPFTAAKVLPPTPHFAPKAARQDATLGKKFL